MAMATPAGNSTPPSPLPSTASSLWARLLHDHGPSKANGTQLPPYAHLTPQDKAGTSTRILLHDTHARLEKFSERANSIFSEIEASKREMVRVREEVESLREKELEAIAQLINRCQSSLQKTIGDPVQAREATAIQASLTLTTERLHALEGKISCKLEALITLLQTQNQLSQSLQEQFSLSQNQQSRILELLAPLHPALQSIPLHISIACNAIMEKIPQGCRCINSCPVPSPPSATSTHTSSSKGSAEAELPEATRKRRKIDLSHSPQHITSTRGDQDRSIGVERHQASVGTRNQFQEVGTPSAVPTPSGQRRGNGTSAMAHSYLGDVQCGSSNAAQATRLSIIARTPPNKSLGRKDITNSFTSLRVPTVNVPGKRFILIGDDDDDDDDNL